jgi:hypothetical protein
MKMKTFEKWIEQNHPEAIEEGWMGKALLAGTAAAGLMAATTGLGAKTQAPGSAATSQEEDWDNDDDDDNSMQRHHQDLLAAAKRAGVPPREWNNLKGHKTGGVVVVVNGRRVPLTKAEQEEVKWAENMKKRMEMGR